MINSKIKSLSGLFANVQIISRVCNLSFSQLKSSKSFVAFLNVQMAFMKAFLLTAVNAVCLCIFQNIVYLMIAHVCDADSIDYNVRRLA